MAQLPQQLLQWLYRVLQPEYSNSVLTYQDISLILMCFNKLLKVKTDIHINELGRTQLLCCLFGNIPVTPSSTAATNDSRQISEVPVEIWVPFNYPASPPIIYVKPTATTNTSILINQSNNIDSNGRFYHPFLSNWTKAYGLDTSNDNIEPKNNRLLNLLNILISTLKTCQPLILKPTLPPKPTSNPLHPTYPPRSSLPHHLAEDSSKLIVHKINPIIQESVASPPPLLPPNPNSISSNLIDSLKRTQATLNQTLKSQLVQQLINPLQNKLMNYTESTINIESYLNFIEAQIIKNNEILQYRTNDFNSFIAKLENKSNVPVDDIIINETIVFNQLYNQVCLLNSLNDLLDQLYVIFNRNKISFELYLKLSRETARDVFNCKILIEKIGDICCLDVST